MNIEKIQNGIKSLLKFSVLTMIIPTQVLISQEEREKND